MMEEKDLQIIKIKNPTFGELFLMRMIAFSSLDKFSFSERLKIKLGLSPIALIFSKFLNSFYILILNHKLIGFAITRLSKCRGLFIHNNFNGKGYGKFFLDYIENDFKQNGKKFIFLRPFKSSKGFYEKRGYNIIGKSFRKDFKAY